MAIYFGNSKVTIGLNETLSNVVRTQSRSVTPSTSSQTLVPDPGYNGMSQVVVNAIPSSYIVPSGTLSISSNSTYNVNSYASVSVNLPYYETYVSLFTSHRITSMTPSINEYLNTFTSLYTDQFAGYTFDGSFTFLNVSQITGVAFSPGGAYTSGTTGGASHYFSFPALISANNGFWGAFSLKGVYAPNLETLIGYYGCFFGTGILEADFPKLNLISGDSHFYNCQDLSRISLPLLTTISGGSTFARCSEITTVNLPMLSRIIGSYTFMQCSKLESINLPLLSYVFGRGMFASCTSLTSVNLNSLITISNASEMFRNCSNLNNISFPELTTITSNTYCMFNGCTNLSVVYFPKLETVENISYIFYNCSKLESVYFTGPQVISVSTLTNVFYGTPIYSSSYLNGRYGSIYVKSSLLTAYQTATGWSSYSSRFVGV